MARKRAVYLSGIHGPVHAVPTYTVKVRGEYGCAMLSRADMVPEQVRCYLSSRPNGSVEIWYSEHCGRCGGSGKLRKKRSRVMFATRPCPACGGNPEIYPDTLLDVWGQSFRRFRNGEHFQTWTLQNGIWWCFYSREGAAENKS